MVSIEYLRDCKGSNKFGTCNGCGKFSNEDESLVRIRFVNENTGGWQGTSICLCSECRNHLFSQLSDLTKGAEHGHGV